MKPAAGRSYLKLFWILALLGLTADLGSKYVIFSWLYADHPREVEPWVAGTEVRTYQSFDRTSQRDAFTRSVELVEGTFSLTATHLEPSIADVEEGDGPLSALRFALRTVSGPNPPHVNHGALFGHDFQFAPGMSNLLFAVVSCLAAVAIIYWSTRPSTRSDWALCVALGLILAGTLGNFYDRVIFGGVRDFLHWYRWFNWPVFNVADCCLVCGAGLLLVHALFTTEEPVAEREAEAASAAPVAVETTTPAGGR